MTTAEALAIEVTAPCVGWRLVCPDAARLAEAAARLALDRCVVPTPLIVDITLTDDDAQRVLNRTYRGQDSATNVLAFPAAHLAEPRPAGAPLLLGDVILAFETVKREAREQNKPLANHLRHLVVHGVLHLLGHDHLDDENAAAMETREIAILAELGVPDPYRGTT
jgi:probable rRNA maturation factor